jgi:putative peptide zinc metalloprotease protein
MADNKPQPLPRLRHDVVFEYAGEDGYGHPMWHIFDPVANKFYRISYVGYHILRFWKHAADIATLVSLVHQKTGLAITEDHIQSMIRFVRVSGLDYKHRAPDVELLKTQRTSIKKSVFTQAVHQYLFFRIPLVKPDRFLERTLPYVRWLGHTWVLWCIVALGLMGIYLISRQFDVFLHYFVNLFSLEGMLYYAIALIFAKIAHELGHAYTTKATGNKVATMGVAFLVMFPVLYTDTTSVWRIRNRKKRIQIAAAGMAVEMGIAAISLLVWNFLPDGALRSAVFLLATTTWIMTLAVNLNPLMRFDGYYLLQDWLDVDNLQTRGFAHARWYMRKQLLGAQQPMPEPVTRRQHLWFIIYSFSTWIYRFFLFLGIAFLVYYFFFKVLGIFLFFVEIIWFILLPIGKELVAWWKMRGQIRWNWKLLRTALIVGGVIGFFVFPFRHDVELAAVVAPEQHTVMFSHAPGRLSELNVTVGQTVREGQVLAVIEDEQLQFELTATAYDLAATKIQLQGGQTEDLKGRDNMQVLDEELRTLSQQFAGFKQQSQENTLLAPFSGVVTAVQDDVRVGTWVGRDQELLRVADIHRHSITAYVAESDFYHLNIGGEGTFYPEMLDHAPFAVRVVRINNSNSPILETPILASVYGGAIAVRPGQDQTLIPESSIYKVTFAPLTEDLDLAREMRGTINYKGAPESLLVRGWRQVVSVFIRESGF